MNKELQAAYEQKEKERKEKERETLRDMIALTAMGALLPKSEDFYSDNAMVIANEAYSMADAMLEAREL